MFDGQGRRIEEPGGFAAGIPDGVEVSTGLDPNVAESTVPALAPLGLGLCAILLGGLGFYRVRRNAR